MKDLVQSGRVLRGTGYLLVTIGLLLQDWTPLLLLVLIALGSEWRSRHPARGVAGVAEGQL